MSAPGAGRAVEPLPVGPGLALAVGVGAVVNGAFAACALVLVCVVVVGVATEQIADLGDAFDAALRGVMAGFLVVLPSALLVLAANRVIELELRMRAAERRIGHRAPTDPEPPLIPRRDAATLDTQRTLPLWVIGLTLVVLGPVTIIVELVSEWEYHGVAALAGLILTGLAIGILAIAARDARRWQARWERLPRSAGAKRPEPSPVPRGRGGIGGLVGLVVGAGGTLFFAGVILKQPCRTCDEIDWSGSPVDGVISALVGLGGFLILIPLALAALSTLPSLIRRFGEERRILREAEAGTLRPDQRTADALWSTGPWGSLAFGLTVIGFTALMIGMIPWGTLANDGADEADRAALAGLDAFLWPGAAIVLLGLATGAIGAVADRARRAAIHRALPGWDYAPPHPADADLPD